MCKANPPATASACSSFFRFLSLESPGYKTFQEAFSSLRCKDMSGMQRPMNLHTKCLEVCDAKHIEYTGRPFLSATRPHITSLTCANKLQHQCHPATSSCEFAHFISQRSSSGILDLYCRFQIARYY